MPERENIAAQVEDVLLQLKKGNIDLDDATKRGLQQQLLDSQTGDVFENERYTIRRDEGGFEIETK